MIEIKDIYDKVLYTAKSAQDVRAAVEEARRNGANLYAADLRGADLRGANLHEANLYGANLRGADLYGANLYEANLRGAEGIVPERINPLLILREQVGKIRAYKLVDADLKSPIQTGNQITYEIGSTVKAKADPDESKDCGAGINLATLPWCLENHEPGHHILICEFGVKDIAAIPDGGKFRVHKAKVVKEVPQEQIAEWLGQQDQGKKAAELVRAAKEDE